MPQPSHLPGSGAADAESSDLVAELSAERDEVLESLAELSSDDPQAALLCGHAGELSYRLHIIGGADEDLDLAVEGFAHAFRRPHEEDGVWSAWRIMFGHLRGLQYDADDSPELLQQCWELLSTGMSGLPADEPGFDEVRALGRGLLASCAKTRYVRRAPDDDTAALLDEALKRHADALADAEAGSEEEVDLRISLGFLHLERCTRFDSAPDAAESARHYRAVLDAGHPDIDVPHVRHSMALALMVKGRATLDREALEEARDAYGTALTEVRNAGGPVPGWAWEAQANSVFIRVMIWSGWKDVGHGAAAEVELTRLLAEPGAEDRLPAQYLDGFGRLLFERSAARDDDAGRDRGVALVRRAVREWDPDRDGDITRTALVLAVFQQSRYQDDPDPRRAQDVLEATGLVLDREQSDPELTQSVRMLDGWARFTLADHGLLPETGGLPEGLDVGTLQAAMQSLVDDVREGRSHLDFGQDEHLPGIGRDMTGRQRRIEGFEKALTMLRATEPGSAARAQLAATMLGSLTMIDPDGTYITAEHRRELTEAVLQRAEHDPQWRGHAHAVVGTSLLREAMAGTGSSLDEAFAHFDLAEAAGNAGGHDLALARLMAQAQRGQTGGGTDDMEAAAKAWRQLRENPALSASTRSSMDLQQASFAAQAAVRQGDLPAADRYLAQLAEGYAEMSDENPSRIEILTLMENARTARDSLAHRLGARPLPPLAGRPGVIELRRQAARLPRDHRAWVLGDNGITRFGRAARAQDGPGLIEAMGLVQEAYDLSDPGSDSRLRYANCLGAGNCMLAEMQIDRVRRRERLARGITYLEGALAEAKGPEHRLYADTGLSLARAYRTRDDLHRRDRAAARGTGLDALRGHTWAALLQSGTDHAALAAAQATSAALEVAGWCVKDDRPEEALQALDACRGLVLHAATTSSTVPDMLAAAGRTDLAEEWHSSGASTADDPGDPLSAARGPLSVPSSLRRRVLAALTSADAPQAALLLDPPAPEEIGGALRALGKDALVYLVPASDDVAGTAVVVTSGGAVHAVPLPTLTEDAAPLKEYAPTGRRTRRPQVPGPGRDLGPVPGFASGAVPPDDAPPPLRKQLDRLCGWAWYAAMRPLLEAFEMPQGRLPRLVLVPMGALGLVPWHAAWEPGGPRGRNYALQAAEISYAASARLLCQVAARPAAPHTGRALVVGNPTGDLYYAGEEADAVQRAFYPDARFLGRRPTGRVDGPGTPREVLEWLRGESGGADTGAGGVLHLACHAAVAENARRSAYLSLSDGRLAAEELTEAVNPHDDGGRLGLVLLAACRSHVSGRGHNEAYSLATAFLVAGARSVIGSLWPVPDEATSVLMYVTHHFLRRHGEPPAKALRRAQLWMLNPDRELPEGLPRTLADRVRRIDPHDLSAWAGFTHLGQ